MIKLIALLLLALGIGAAIAPGLRDALAWVLAFLSLLMLGSLVRSSVAKRRQRPGSTPRRA